VVDLGAELLARAKAGDMQAWSRIYQNNFDRIFRSLCLHVSDPDLAEDLAQETFAEALANLGSFRGDSRFSTWLHGIAINRARRHWRWKRNTANAHEKLTQVSKLTAPTSPDPAATTMRAAKVRALYSILEQIPDNLREVFVLRDVEGLPQREVAAQLGISEGNAAVRATRARARVRKELEQLGWLSPKAPSEERS
jgi:RNA polymerase sigma-70 factor (ECF subfamily)